MVLKYKILKIIKDLIPQKYVINSIWLTAYFLL